MFELESEEYVNSQFKANFIGENSDEISKEAFMEFLNQNFRDNKLNYTFILIKLKPF